MLIDLHAHLPHPDMLNQHPHWGPFYGTNADGDMSLRIGKWKLSLGIPERRAALKAGKLDSLEETLARRGNPHIRIRQMDADGWDAQVLSPPAHNAMYHTEHEFAISFAAHINDVMAKYCANYPDRLYFWAHAPLQNPPAAAKELRRAVTELGAVGLSMGGANFGGLEVDDAEMDVVWQTCCDLDVPLFVHGYNQSVTWGDDADKERYEITSIVGMMYDETRLFWNMICGGVLDRFPALKIYITHAGGFVPYHLGRFEVTNSVLRTAKNKKPLLEYMPNFYFDMLTHDRGMRRAIFDVIGADRLFYGSNYNGSDGIREDLTAGIDLTEEERAKIRSENAIKVLRINPGHHVKPAEGQSLARAL
jgi:predicted TIM-barrel fold metal-dependent hydrolase